MTDTVPQLARYLRDHAEAVMKMPAGEQFIGARDVAFHSAMLQIADALDQLHQRVAALEREAR
jgi:hypothetical protein